MKLRIDRKRWLNGASQESYSCLLDSHTGKMCCLGFLVLACGAKKSQIKNWTDPSDVSDLKWPEGLLHICKNGIEHTELCSSLISINDSFSLEKQEREKELTELFKKINVDVEFVD